MLLTSLARICIVAPFSSFHQTACVFRHQDLGAATEVSARLNPRVGALEQANDELRTELTAAREKRADAELELAQVRYTQSGYAATKAGTGAHCCGSAFEH